MLRPKKRHFHFHLFKMAKTEKNFQVATSHRQGERQREREIKVRKNFMMPQFSSRYYAMIWKCKLVVRRRFVCINFSTSSLCHDDGIRSEINILTSLQLFVFHPLQRFLAAIRIFFLRLLIVTLCLIRLQTVNLTVKNTQYFRRINLAICSQAKAPTREPTNDLK